MNDDFNNRYNDSQDNNGNGSAPDSDSEQNGGSTGKKNGGTDYSAGDSSGDYGSGNSDSGSYGSGNSGSGNYGSGNSGSGNSSSDSYGSGNSSSGSYGAGSYGSGSNSGNSGSNNDNSAYGGNTQYRWYYDDYQRALEHKAQAQKSAPETGGDKTEKRRRRRGLKTFLITVASVFGVAVLGLAVVGVTSIAGLTPRVGGGAAAASSSSSSVESGAKGDSSSGPALDITSQPSSSGSQVAASSGELSVAQVAAKLTPAVVGVVDYNLQSVEPTAEGSGIVMTVDGYIITNAHVISGAQEVQVVVPKGKTYTARIIGSDTKTDLAVLKIDTKGTKLQYATFGDSSQLQLGQNVIAIGNPGGLTLAGTVTNGIISGLNRQVGDTTSSMTYIQTNALINPGNSGGPLVNMYGQVVGINSSKIEETGYEGIGFAIPISTAKPIVDSLIKNGYVTGRVKIGISVYPLSTTYVQSRNYPSGLYVTNIDKTSDAYAKGLRTRDIITKINGVSISSDDSTSVYDKFYQEEAKHKVGDTVTLTVYRIDTGNTLTFSIKLLEDKGDDSSSTGSQSDNGGNDGSNGSNGSNGGDNGNGGYSGNGGSGGSGNSYWGSFGQ